MKTIITTAALMLVSLSSHAANAASVNFTDDFEAQSNTTSIYPYNSHSIYNSNSFANWTVSQGTVDLKGWDDSNTSSCYNNSKYCVDLDGSSKNAGVFATKDGFAAGTYKVSFALSGNQRIDNDNLTVKFGTNTLLDNVLIAYNSNWTMYNYTVKLAEGDKLSFANAGGDNIGVLLDNISISSVPVPAAAFLFAPVLLGFISLGRRRSV